MEEWEKKGSETLSQQRHSHPVPRNLPISEAGVFIPSWAQAALSPFIWEPNKFQENLFLVLSWRSMGPGVSGEQCHGGCGHWEPGRLLLQVEDVQKDIFSEFHTVLEHKGCSFSPLLLVETRNYQCWEELRPLASGSQWGRSPRNQTHSDPHMGGEILKGLILF